MTEPGPSSLAELEERLARDLELLILPTPEWSPPHGDLLDVAIVGAGMAGLIAAVALQRLGISRVSLFSPPPSAKRKAGSRPGAGPPVPASPSG